MSDFKNILAYVGVDEGCSSRLQLATDLALQFSAHLTGVHIMPQAVYTPYLAIQFPTETYDEMQHREQEINDKLRDKFHKIVADKGISDYSWVQLKSAIDRCDHLLHHHARYHDILLLPQRAHDKEYDNHIVPESAIMEGSAPVIVTPEDASFSASHANLLIAWNASSEAARAVHMALPLIKQAKTVHAIIISEKKELPEHESINHGEELKRYFKSHGVSIKLHTEANPKNLKTSDILLDFIKKKSIDFLVMGGYHHSRMRESLYGGASYKMLGRSPIPILISH